MFKPAALGGLFIGVLSALPIIGIGNCCCCLWIVTGGLLASYLASGGRSTSLPPAEGALVGGLAGVVGAFVWLPVTVLVAIVMSPVEQAIAGAILSNARDLPPEAREVLENLGQGSSVMRHIVGFVLMFFAGAVFGAIGGLIGATFFRKDVPPALGGTHVPPIPQEMP
jgi:hypothetical protein